MDFFKDERINSINEFARANHIPIMLDETAKFLQKKLLQFNPKSVLEIGTAVGYSGALILSTLKDCFLKTVEIDEERYNLAKRNFQEFGVSDRVESFCDDALNFISALQANGECFDFIFLDGPKGQQYKYLPILKNLLKVGGVLFVDDFNYHANFIREDGYIPHKHRAMVKNLKKFVEAIKSDEDFKCTYYEIDEGILIAQKL